MTLYYRFNFSDQCIAQVFKMQQINMSTVIKEQKEHLCHSLKFDQAKYIVYFTRSNLEMENRELLHIIMSNHAAESDNATDIHQGFEIEFSTGFHDIIYTSLITF